MRVLREARKKRGKTRKRRKKKQRRRKGGRSGKRMKKGRTNWIKNQLAQHRIDPGEGFRKGFKNNSRMTRKSNDTDGEWNPKVCGNDGDGEATRGPVVRPGQAATENKLKSARL